MNRFTHIAFENPNVAALAKGMLAKAVHNAAWTQLTQHVTYKAADADGVVVMIDPRGTSQTCPECGTIKPKTLTIREHCCECGCVLARNVLAARIVLRRANFGPGTGLQPPSQRGAA